MKDYISSMSAKGTGMSKPMVSVRISESLSGKIDTLSALTQRPRSEVLSGALEEFVDEKVRLYQEIDAAVKEADESGEWISHEKMSEWMLSWGSDNELPPPEPGIFTKTK